MSSTGGNSDAGPKTYAIDIRVFLAVITTSMALAFSAGIAFGPSDPESVVATLEGNALMRPLRPLLMPFLLGEDADGMVTSSSSMSSNDEDDRADYAVRSYELVEGMGGKKKLQQHMHQHSGKGVQEVEISSTGEARQVDVDDQYMFDDEGKSVDEDDEEESSEDEEEDKVAQPKRKPTAHVAELGYKIRETHVNIEQPVLEDLGDVNDEKRTIQQRNASASGEVGDDELFRDQHMPAGQHLLVDIKNLDAEFLNSESRLAKAMSDTVDAGGLTLLSYHCHSLHPAGVSCVGVLLESHISFHTWPDEGVITLDLFTCGAQPLVPVLPQIEALFGIPRINNSTGEPMKIETLWSHELRGFRSAHERSEHYLDDESDLATWVTSPLDLKSKEQIVGIETEFQRIDIWDVLEREDTPTYTDGMKHGFTPGDPRWLDNSYSTPSRILFLDGVAQSLSDSEQEYHETLVHPAMFAHSNPKSVAIVGGGEGATLREVLKHKTVTKATMIEIDEQMVEIARKHLASMSNCSDIPGSAPVCFEDPRADVLYANALEYFSDEFGTESSGAFDVVIVDALDPEEEDAVAEQLYADAAFHNSLVDSLTDQGILAVQIGTAPNILDPRADMGVYAQREQFIRLMEEHEKIAAVFVYEEAHCGFLEPHSFLVACRDASCRERWYAETDAVDYSIYERIGGTKSGLPSLVHFDGATHRSFQIAPRAWETVYCRREPEPFECQYRGLDQQKELFEYLPEDEEENSFEVRATKDKNGDNDSDVHALVDIPEGSYIMPSHLAASLTVSDASIENLKGNTRIEGTGPVTVIEDFLEFLEEFGHPSMHDGSGTNLVEIGGSFLINTADENEESNVRRWIPAHPSGSLPKFSPVYERHRRSFDVFLVASRDIKAGEKLLKPAGLWDLK